MAGEKATCELCGKEKKISKMLEYYIDKRSDNHRIMYKCRKCSDLYEQPLSNNTNN